LTKNQIKGYGLIKFRKRGITCNVNCVILHLQAGFSRCQLFQLPPSHSLLDQLAIGCLVSNTFLF